MRCEKVWDADSGFWTAYTVENLFRSQFYLEELDLSVGIELEQTNLDAVRQALTMLVGEVFCGQTSLTDARAAVTSMVDITDAQRAAFLQMIKVRENGHWNFCVTWRP